LTDAAIRGGGARDDLLGLKENIIIGHLIPAGTASIGTTTSNRAAQGFQPRRRRSSLHRGAVPSPFPEEVEQIDG